MAAQNPVPEYDEMVTKLLTVGGVAPDYTAQLSPMPTPAPAPSPEKFQVFVGHVIGGGLDVTIGPLDSPPQQ